MISPAIRTVSLGALMLAGALSGSLAQPAQVTGPALPTNNSGSGIIVRPPLPICRPSVSTSLNVQLAPQQTNMWCWAASGQMVMAYFGVNVTQCSEANDRFGRNDCCNNPTPAACVQGGWPEFNKHGFTYAMTNNAALSWAEVRAQIAPRTLLSPCWGQPFAFSWHWLGGGGHMMVARGYKTVGNTNWVQINDPWPPNAGSVRYITYDSYVAVANDHTHWNDYYHFVKH